MTPRRGRPSRLRSLPGAHGGGALRAEPESSRYLYPAALFLLLVGGFALTDAPRRRVLVVGATTVAFVVWANVDELHRQDQITIVGQRLESNLTALELARDRVAPRVRDRSRGHLS